jgi:hypothetical protein
VHCETREEIPSDSSLEDTNGDPKIMPEEYQCNQKQSSPDHEADLDAFPGEKMVHSDPPVKKNGEA